ncbi:MAG: hypothetical protein H6573_28110 [Lewinellaceae bacterium]|nr:hypothetical protein [Lewinellaceae bacterium]
MTNNFVPGAQGGSGKIINQNLNISYLYQKMEFVYQRLVELRIWHDYFSSEDLIPERAPRDYEVNFLFDIQPSDDTRKLLANYRLLWRQTPYGILIGTEIKAGNPTQTLIKIEEKLKFAFVLSLKDPYLLNYSNLPLDLNEPRLYVFDNFSGNKLSLGRTRYLFLSKPMEGYNPGRQYKIGDLIRANNRTYEVKDLPVESAPGPAGGQAEWRPGANTQYVTRNDTIATYDKVYLYKGPNHQPGTDVTFQVTDIFGKVIPLGNKNIPGLDEPVELAHSPQDPARELEHSLSLGNLPMGRYSLNLSGNPIDVFYRLEKKRHPKAWAVVEFHYTPPGNANPEVPANFAFIDPGPNPSEPLSIPMPKVFHLRFKNRSTFWRYLSAKDRSEIYTKGEPLPIQKAYFEVKDDNNVVLPHPTVTRITREIDDTGMIDKEKFYSQIYI